MLRPMAESTGASGRMMAMESDNGSSVAQGESKQQAPTESRKERSTANHVDAPAATTTAAATTATTLSAPSASLATDSQANLSGDASASSEPPPLPPMPPPPSKLKKLKKKKKKKQKHPKNKQDEGSAQASPSAPPATLAAPALVHTSGQTQPGGTDFTATMSSPDHAKDSSSSGVEGHGNSGPGSSGASDESTSQATTPSRGKPVEGAILLDTPDANPNKRTKHMQAPSATRTATANASGRQRNLVDMFGTRSEDVHDATEATEDAAESEEGPTLVSSSLPSPAPSSSSSSSRRNSSGVVVLADSDNDAQRTASQPSLTTASRRRKANSKQSQPHAQVVPSKQGQGPQEQQATERGPSSSQSTSESPRRRSARIRHKHQQQQDGGEQQQQQQRRQEEEGRGGKEQALFPVFLSTSERPGKRAKRGTKAGDKAPAHGQRTRAPKKGKKEGIAMSAEACVDLSTDDDEAPTRTRRRGARGTGRDRGKGGGGQATKKQTDQRTDVIETSSSEDASKQAARVAPIFLSAAERKRLEKAEKQRLAEARLRKQMEDDRAVTQSFFKDKQSLKQPTFHREKLVKDKRGLALHSTPAPWPSPTNAIVPTPPTAFPWREQTRERLVQTRYAPPPPLAPSSTARPPWCVLQRAPSLGRAKTSTALSSTITIADDDEVQQDVGGAKLTVDPGSEGCRNTGHTTISTSTSGSGGRGGRGGDQWRELVQSSHYHQAAQQASNNTARDWATALAPHHPNDVIGNTSQVSTLFSWLEEWKDRLQRARDGSGPASQNREEADEEDMFIWDSTDDEEEASQRSGRSKKDRAPKRLRSLFTLTGPSSCGKTAAIHACANTLGFQVLELNTSMLRSGREVTRVLQEATQSHRVSRCKLLPGRAAQMADVQLAHASILVIEDADVLFDDDKGFWAALNSLAPSAKRPIILTTTGSHPWRTELRFAPKHELHLSRPHPVTLAQHGMAAICVLGGRRKHAAHNHTAVGAGAASGDVFDMSSTRLSTSSSAQSLSQPAASSDPILIPSSPGPVTPPRTQAPAGSCQDLCVVECTHEATPMPDMAHIQRIAEACNADTRQFFLTLQLWTQHLTPTDIMPRVPELLAGAAPAPTATARTVRCDATRMVRMSCERLYSLDTQCPPLASPAAAQQEEEEEGEGEQGERKLQEQEQKQVQQQQQREEEELRWLQAVAEHADTTAQCMENVEWDTEGAASADALEAAVLAHGISLERCVLRSRTSAQVSGDLPLLPFNVVEATPADIVAHNFDQQCLHATANTPLVNAHQLLRRSALRTDTLPFCRTIALLSQLAAGRSRSRSRSTRFHHSIGEESAAWLAARSLLAAETCLDFPTIGSHRPMDSC